MLWERHYLIGHSAPPWRAFLASAAARGRFADRELVGEFGVTREQVEAVLQFAAWSAAAAIQPQ